MTGDVVLSELHTDIPAQRSEQAARAAAVLGASIYDDLPFAENTQPESSSVAELILRRTWKPALSITGCDGMPAIANAGNVTLPQLSVKLSMRLPPLSNAEQAAVKMKKILKKIHRIRLMYSLKLKTRDLAGMHRQKRPGCWHLRIRLHKIFLVSQPCIWVKVARFPSWACWVKNSRKRSLLLLAC